MFVPTIIGGSEPGSVTYSTPGTYSFTVPEYTTLSVDVKGGGGAAYLGGNGSASSFNSTVFGNGGSQGTTYSFVSWPSPAASGTASGGDTNTTGGGASGGAGYVADKNNGESMAPAYHQAGGPGGRAVKGYTSGLTPGSTVTVVVGTGGSGAGNGSVTISWT